MHVRIFKLFSKCARLNWSNIKKTSARRIDLNYLLQGIVLGFSVKKILNAFNHDVIVFCIV